MNPVTEASNDRVHQKKENLMKKIQVYRTSEKGHLLTVLGLFLFMLILNILTKRFADDYTYAFHFGTGERLEHFGEIYESMIAHGQGINGRYFAHFLAQFFLLLPDLVFDVINAAVFVFTICAVYRVANAKKKTDNLFFLAIFGCVWLFEFDFGQINLWLDGACNYLFGVFWGLLYILPYIRSLMCKKNLHPLLILPHMAASLLLGGYLEPLTVGFGCMAGLFFLADLFYFKNKQALRLIPSLLCSALGLWIMASAPAEKVNKLGSFTVASLANPIGRTFGVALSLLPLAWLFFALRKRAKREQVDRRVLLTADILSIGAMVSNLIMLIAKYYPLRCSVACIFLSIFSVALLYGNVEDRKFGSKFRIIYKTFVLALAVTMLAGVADNFATFVILQQNETVMEEAVKNGETECSLYIPIPVTKYNGLRSLKYLNTEDPSQWPNNHVAQYYGLEKVEGKSRLKEFWSQLR